MNINFLTDHINKLKKDYDDEYWLNNLSERKKEELLFHDRDRDEDLIKETINQGNYEKYYGNVKYYDTAIRSRNYVHEWILNETKNKVFLDYACGNGLNAIKAAECGAELSIGMDISSKSIKNAEKKSKDLDLNNIIFYQGDAENTLLPDNSVDIILCSEMLHHLDLSYAFHELRRILKPNGKILAVEALAYNPIIGLYRKLTPNMRTKWESEHILGFKEIEFAKHFFEVKNMKFWHIIGYLGAKISFLKHFLNKVDLILEKIPLIRNNAWMFTFELHKKDKS